MSRLLDKLKEYDESYTVADLIKELEKDENSAKEKENAETFIKENRPQYSLNDIRNVLTKQMECTHWIMIDVDNIIKDLENER